MATKSKELLKGLSKDKLKSLIFYLTQKYYEGYIDNDREVYDFAIEQLFFIVEEYADEYVNLQAYICFCLYINANAVIVKGETELQKFTLEPLFKVDLLEDDVEELAHDIKNIFNKERIKERYNAQATREHVE